MTVTVVIITKSIHISKLVLGSLSFADEVILVVDAPTPKHRTTKGKYKIFSRPLSGDYSAQRNFGLQKATSEWVLFVDDDEYVGIELAREITSILATSKFSGYLIPRTDVVFHQRLLHGETGNMKLLRLACRTAGKFYRPVHETWKIAGRVGELTSPLYHIKDHFISEFIGRMESYGQIDAKILARENKPFSWFRLLAYPLAKFKYNYFLKAGFLDGIPGLFLAYLMGVQSLTVRVFQWENQK